MSSRNPNSRTSGSSSPSPSPSPNSGENRENIAPQREEIQADETLPKEEQQSAADTADSAQENPVEEIPKQENPDEKFPKAENPDEKIPEEEDMEEEDPEEQIPKQENDPYEDVTQEEDPEEENPVEEIPEQENHTFEQNRGIGNGELVDPAIAEIFTAIPGIKRIRIQRPENPPFDLNRGIGIAEPENPTISDIFRELENPSFDDMFSSVFTFETNRGIGNREQENPTTAASIPLIEPNSGIGTRKPENPTIIKIFPSIPPIEPNRGNGITEPDDPTTAIRGNKRIRIQRRENPKIDASFDSRPTINPNRGFTIRDPQNPTNNPAPAAVPEQQDKGKVKDENLRQTNICKCSSECFLFPRSTSEEEDDIITLKFVSVYRTNQEPLPSASSPEHFDALSAFISSQLPQGESISLDSLEEKLAKLLKKYLRLLRHRDISLNFEALTTNYDRDLYRLGREVWGNANAQGYRVPGVTMGEHVEQVKFVLEDLKSLF